MLLKSQMLRNAFVVKADYNGRTRV